MDPLGVSGSHQHRNLVMIDAGPHDDHRTHSLGDLALHDLILTLTLALTVPTRVPDLHLILVI